MKQLTICMATILSLFCMAPHAEAKNPENVESDHVIVTLKSGEKIDCYIHRGWQAEESMFKKENYAFKVLMSPDDKDPVEYTTDDVESIDYVEVTEAHPDGLRWESRPLASPSFSSRYNTIQRLLCVEKVGKNATTYWWKIWTSTGRNLASRQLVTYMGVRFHNDPEGIVYPYTLVNSVLMKDKYPGLKEFCKQWFKGPEGKMHKKEADENDSWILEMYDAYLAQRAAEATPETASEQQADDAADATVE